MSVKPSYTIEYLDELPKTTIQIKSIFGHELKFLKYWFDYEKCRVVKQNGKEDKHPFRYMRGHQIHIAVKDSSKSDWNHKMIIDALSKSWNMFKKSNN